MYRQLKEGTGNILGFKIVGGITKKQKKQICEVLEKHIGKSGKIRLLLVVEPRGNMDSEALLFDLSIILSYAESIERMALIGHKAWEQIWVALFGLFSKIRTQYFDRSDIQAAWKWICA